MTHMLERPRIRRPFHRADILSQLGETIFLPDQKVSTPKHREEPQQQCAIIEHEHEEDPERWDGMS